MKIIASVISHPGKCRDKNEDNFCFHGEMLTDNCTSRPLKFRGNTSSPILMGVFDGMGGIKAGEIASRMAAEVACSSIEYLDNITEIEAYELALCKHANALICDEMTNVIKQRMGTTASMLCFSKEHYHLCNVGDSPIFLFRNDKLLPIFHEHTEKENYLSLYSSKEALPKKKFKLTQNIGIFPEEMEIEPYIFSDTLENCDRFLITSDGLTDMVDTSVISEVLARRMSPARTVTKLVQLALDNGGRDNITIICIDASNERFFLF